MFGYLKRRIDPERERKNLQRRYFSFKELLAANDDSLAIIADLENEVINPEYLLMSRIRHQCTSLGINVFKVVRNLETISGKSYPNLRETLSRVSRRVEEELYPEPNPGIREFTIPIDGLSSAASVSAGLKMATLGEIRNKLSIAVPDGFVITAHAFRRFYGHNKLTPRINGALMEIRMSDPAQIEDITRRIREMIVGSEIPPDMLEAIQQSYSNMEKAYGPNPGVAVRSSGVAEDSESSSFAGLYLSVLNVPREGLGEAYKQVLASKYSSRSIYYLANRGLRDEELAMCVGCIRMIDAMVSGIMYTRAPEFPSGLLINAGWGLGPSIAGGKISPDVFVIDKSTGKVLEKKISDQSVMLISREGGGIFEAPIPRIHSQETCLNRRNLDDLTKVGLKLEEYFGKPQDVEFSIDDRGDLFILQSRPLPTEKLLADNGEKQPAVSVADTRDEHVDVGDAQILMDYGDTACRGVGAGIAWHVGGPKDLANFPDRGVLVAKQLFPEWIELIGRIRAIVTEVGSPTGHMASIAREFNVPMIVNATDAMKLIPGGREITVDANRRIVYGSIVVSLLSSDSGRSDFLTGSPVYASLERILKKVATLNLLDPRLSGFRASNTRTYHDILRFAHEESIGLMFNLNDSHFLKSDMGLKLDIEVPLNIFVMDLGGGIDGGKTKGRKISIDRIKSQPLQALVRGMTTPGVKWAGHVPIGFKSFMSVFANTLYDAQKGERMLGAQSYAIVSGNYLNFSSRLGYHFSTLDTFCGPERNSNYIIFRFKGGAASLNHRELRGRFISKVLELHDFRVDQKQDLVNAHLKKRTCEETEDRLTTLGRLMGCARQLDVVMSSPSVVDIFVAKFMEGNYNFFERPGTK